MLGALNILFVLSWCGSNVKCCVVLNERLNKSHYTLHKLSYDLLILTSRSAFNKGKASQYEFHPEYILTATRENWCLGFLTRSDTNLLVQSQQRTTSLKSDLRSKGILLSV